VNLNNFIDENAWTKYNFTVIVWQHFAEGEMARSKIALAALAFGLSVVVAAPSVWAQGAGKPAVKEKSQDEGYGYEFEDDPLNAGGFGPNDATIRVRPRAARTTLIRPRTSFVPEMLKSVENI
jgi:hypothetical protein